MSNLFRSGIIPPGNVISEPFVLNANEKVMEKINSYSKIIRPVEEKQEDEEEKEAENKIVLDEAMDMATSIREEATEKANQIVAAANEEAEGIKNAAYQEGYERGLVEGKMEAARRADEYLENIQQEQEAVFKQHEEECDAIIEQAKRDIVDFAGDIISKFTGILVEDYSNVMLHMINNALSGEETGKNIIIKIPEESFSYIYDNKDRISGALNPGINIEIFGDASLKRQKCIIETDNGIIDLSMDVQVNNLITALKLLSN